MYFPDDVGAMIAKIRWIAVDLLGDRASTVQVETRDMGSVVGIGVRSPEGWRHAVIGDADDIIADPEKWTRAACTALIAWLDAKAAAEQPGTA